MTKKQGSIATSLSCRFYIVQLRSAYCVANDGLVAMNPLTQERTPRRSSALFAEICHTNAITDDMVERYAPQAMERVFWHV